MKIEETYKSTFNSLSLRAQRAVTERYSSVASLISLLFTDSMCEMGRNCGAKTIEELKRFAHELLDDIMLSSSPKEFVELDGNTKYQLLCHFMTKETVELLNKTYPNYDDFICAINNSAIIYQFSKLQQSSVLELTYMVQHYCEDDIRLCIRPQLLYLKKLDDGTFSTRALHGIRYAGLENWWILYDQIINHRKDLLMRNRNLGTKTINELDEFVEMFYDTLIGQPVTNPKTLYEEYRELTDPGKIEMISRAYNDLLESYSPVYLKRIKDVFGSFEDCLKKFPFDTKVVKGSPATRQHYISAANSLQKRFHDRTREIIQSSNNDIEEFILQKKCQYLSHDDYLFVHDFHIKHGYYPIFFMTYKYLLSSQARSENILKQLAGIDCEPRTRKEIADNLHISPERVRQLYVNVDGYDITKETFMTKENWCHYPFITQPYLTPENTNFIEILSVENVDMTFSAFCYICSLSNHHFELLEICKRLDGHLCSPKRVRDEYEVGCLLTYAYQSALSGFRYYAMLADIDNIKYNKVRKGVCKVNINELIMDKKYCDSNQIEDIKACADFIRFLIEDCLELKCTNNEITFAATVIDYKSILHQILKEKGSPMSIDELFEALKKQYPDQKYTMSVEIRRLLNDRKLFRPIGRKSIYTTTDSLEYTGSLQEAIIAILQMTGVPMKRKELINEVVKFRPDTNEKSLRSIIFMMADDDVIQYFEHNQIGLTELKEAYGDEYGKEAQNEKHLSFDERVEAYRLFMQTYQRTPFIGGCNEEASLARWYNRTGRLELEMPSDVLQTWMQLKRDIAESHVPTTSLDYVYKENVEKYKSFVLQNARPLNPKDDNKDLFKWFQNNLLKYGKIGELQKYYFDDLLDVLKCFGYDFDGYIKMYMTE